jgi:hypothetical protein
MRFPGEAPLFPPVGRGAARVMTARGTPDRRGMGGSVLSGLLQSPRVLPPFFWESVRALGGYLMSWLSTSMIIIGKIGPSR